MVPRQLTGDMIFQVEEAKHSTSTLVKGVEMRSLSDGAAGELHVQSTPSRLRKAERSRSPFKNFFRVFISCLCSVVSSPLNTFGAPAPQVCLDPSLLRKSESVTA